MSATTRIIIASLAICSILVTSTSAFSCYVASSSDANFPTQQQVTMSYNCTACVRGKYVYANGQSGSIFIWGCMTGSTGMVAQTYPGAWGAGTWNNWGTGTWNNWGAAAGPWSNWGGAQWNTWGAGVPAWAGAAASWAGWNSWGGAGMPWSSWGAPGAYVGAPGVPGAVPGAGYYNQPGAYNSNYYAYANMCVDGSFDGYSKPLGAYAYMCVCCEDSCNQNLRCKTFNGANTIVAVSSSLATLLALTFAVVNVLHA